MISMLHDGFELNLFEIMGNTMRLIYEVKLQ